MHKPNSSTSLVTPPVNNIATFSQLNLHEQILKALADVNYTTPTPIQAQAIPLILNKFDFLGIAQTGTGKTAAFLLPIIDLLFRAQTPRSKKSPKVLILTPTRELAIQIHQNAKIYGKYLKQKYSVIFGGVGQSSQVSDLADGTDVLIATPGRLLDLIDQRLLRLDSVQTFVLDEADRMLDMGFFRDIKKILPMLPPVRHNLFFSATMPPEISSLAQTILKNPKTVAITPPSTTVERIHQSVMFVEKSDKLNLLIHLLQNPAFKKVLVFVEMKHVANRLLDKLLAHGITGAVIHGNKSQNARQHALDSFDKNKIQVLVATDIASRGIDIEQITHVINFELSHIIENYVHRIGRTARAGEDGKSIIFCDAEEKSFLLAIENETKQKIEVVINHPYHSKEAMNAITVSLGKAKAMRESKRQEFKRNNRSHQKRTR